MQALVPHTKEFQGALLKKKVQKLLFFPSCMPRERKQTNKQVPSKYIFLALKSL